MKRKYESGIADNVSFFTGIEVEKTPAHGMDTLFVTGLQSCDVIQEKLEDRQHIFFGANHSFEPLNEDEWIRWERMIKAFIIQK